MARNTDPSWTTIQKVRERDEYACVLCFVNDALQTHHRRLRGIGGSTWRGINLPSNLITVCPSCHAYIHANPKWSKQEGLIVSHFSDPAAIPLRVLRHGWLKLTENGKTEHVL